MPAVRMLKISSKSVDAETSNRRRKMNKNMDLLVTGRKSEFSEKSETAIVIVFIRL